MRLSVVVANRIIIRIHNGNRLYINIYVVYTLVCCFQMLSVIAATRIITFLVGDPYKPLCATVAGSGSTSQVVLSEPSISMTHHPLDRPLRDRLATRKQQNPGQQRVYLYAEEG